VLAPPVDSQFSTGSVDKVGRRVDDTRRPVHMPWTSLWKSSYPIWENRV